MGNCSKTQKNCERKRLMQLFELYYKKPKLGFFERYFKKSNISEIIDFIEKSTLPAFDLIEIFLHQDLTKISDDEFNILIKVLDKKEQSLKSSLSSFEKNLKFLHGKELTTQQKDVEQTRDKLHNHQAFSAVVKTKAYNRKVINQMQEKINKETSRANSMQEQAQVEMLKQILGWLQKQNKEGNIVDLAKAVKETEKMAYEIAYGHAFTQAKKSLSDLEARIKNWKRPPAIPLQPKLEVKIKQKEQFVKTEKVSTRSQASEGTVQRPRGMYDLQKQKEGSITFLEELKRKHTEKANSPPKDDKNAPKSQK